MNIPDEKLMAYADGELDAASRAEVEAAMTADPEIARRVEQHQALRKKLHATFDPVLMETVPDRLVAAMRSAPKGSSGAAGVANDAAYSSSAGTAAGINDSAAPGKREATVTDLRRVRAARAAEAAEAAAAARREKAPRRPWTWVQWSAMAASVLVGAVIAHLAWDSPGNNRFGTRGGQIIAHADLASALTQQLASEQPAGSDVRIGLSFKAKDGSLCRTFLVKDENPLGGLACRTGNAWRVQVLANAPAPAVGANGEYAQAGSEMPAAVMAAAQATIEGEPLDAAGEVAARNQDWEK